MAQKTLFRPSQRDQTESNELGKGRRRSELLITEKMIEAIEAFCFKCSEGKSCPGKRWDFPTCPFVGLRAGKGGSISSCIQKICWRCMTINTNTTGICSSWYSCPLYSYSVPKPQHKAISDINNMIDRRAKKMPMIMDEDFLDEDTDQKDPDSEEENIGEKVQDITKI
jgi:hypothetical protein